ncbi:ABC transporter ATP-binding protein [Dactylosporangium roseum]|uniref:ABC transporter ATP-binding protein n=2 Tax=Dactylosporangium roseum TaxID=47989 RepID=A0ABY5Z149_9ACTN|nr:ABC transporter ATP-binding protein [Dactylosporangium roseum]UWZ34503.1 ABC transporter ATP-binding protein [Dactylosporangium roseum]
MNAMSTGQGAAAASASAAKAPVLTTEDLRVEFTVGHQTLVAVDGVSLSVAAGETLALVGESGSGKSTVALALMRAHEPDSGRIIFEGTDITHLSERRLKPVRRRLQMVIQDPYASLDPRMTIARVVAEPLVAHRWGNRRQIADRVVELLELVGLTASAMSRYPSQFSGGQRQRISIARALALEPSMIIADEPVSALDMSIQAQIINLLGTLQRERDLAYLVIAHDLALVHQISNRVAVLYLGRVVEEGTTDQVVWSPQHPYTAALLSATPTPDNPTRERIVLAGDPPSAINRPSGCVFHPRCPIARSRCAVEVPPLIEVRPGVRTACFYPGEVQPVIDASQSRPLTAKE